MCNSPLIRTNGYRLTFLAFTDDGETEFLTGFYPYAEYALRRWAEMHPGTAPVWRFDGDCWESEDEFTRNGLVGRYGVMWWDE